VVAGSSPALAARSRQLSTRKAAAYTATHAVSRCRDRLGPGTGTGRTAPAAAGSDPDSAGSDDGDGSPASSSSRGDGPRARRPYSKQPVESLPHPFESPRPQGPPHAVPGQPTSKPAAGGAIAPPPARGAPHVDAWLVAPSTTVYTRLTQSDLQKVISEFDKNSGGENRDSRPAPHGT